MDWQGFFQHRSDSLCQCLSRLRRWRSLALTASILATFVLMKPLLTAILAAASVSGHLLTAAEPRSRESFDQGWRFARFGLQADGTRLAEPGGTPVWSIQLSASTEEAI